MAIEIKIPRLGWSMESGKFLGWMKADKSHVVAGEPLFTLETDKAAQEVESFDSGILHIPEDGPLAGETVSVGNCIGYILAHGEVPPVRDSFPAVEFAAEPASAKALPLPSREASTLPSPSERKFPASPRAKRAAKRQGINLNEISPTGTGGRVRERDVLAAVAAMEGQSMRRIPISQMRRSIANRLMLSRQTTVPVTITCRCNATSLLALRAQLKRDAAATDSVHTPTINDILVKLTGSALKRHPMLTARWTDDELLIPDGLHIGIAVDTDAGLVVPVVRDVQRSSLTQIAEQTRELIGAARSQNLKPAAMRDASFTVSNLGGLGVESFTPVINPPESAILGVGSIIREAVPLPDNTMGIQDRLTLCLTFDHRVIDGADAARFLQTLRTLVEQPIGGIL